jgi:hypothetical protein
MPGDAITVAPHLYKVLLDNDRVRVLEVRAQPGVTSALHTLQVMSLSPSAMANTGSRHLMAKVAKSS